MSDKQTGMYQQINKISILAKEYFYLDDREHIMLHQQLLPVLIIRGSKHKNIHPHTAKHVYISRRSLKHYVESRKKELLKNHTKENALQKILFAVNKIPEVIINFDRYELEPPNHAYIKDYSNIGYPSLRVLLDTKKEHLEIKSIHFTKIRIN